MRLGGIGKAILVILSQTRGGRASRSVFLRCYENSRAKPKNVIDALTKTLERMIEGGLLVGHGQRTPKKWYIKEVRLTSLGRKVAKKIRGAQQRLPL